MACHDCGKETHILNGDYYMVTPLIWNKYGLGGSYLYEDGWREDTPSGELCMSCLEDRMGRKLEKSDLLICPLNYLNPYTNKLLNS